MDYIFKYISILNVKNNNDSFSIQSAKRLYAPINGKCRIQYDLTLKKKVLHFIPVNYNIIEDV